MPLGVHQRRAAPLSGEQAQHVVAEDAVQELLAQRAGDGQHAAVGEVDEGRALAGGGVPGLHGVGHRLARAQPFLVGSKVANRVARSSACSSSTARIPSSIRRVVGSSSPT